MANLRLYDRAGRGFDMADAKPGTFLFDVGISDAQFMGESRYDLDTYIWHYRDPSSTIAREFSVFLSFPNPYEVEIENIYFVDRQGRPTMDLYGAHIVMDYDDLVSEAPDWVFNGFSGPDTIVGSKYADVIEGGSRGDALYGRGGGDRLYGERGNDYLEGDGGRDHLFGGPGDDTLRGGTGRDTLAGGTGADTFEFTSARAAGIGRSRDRIADFDLQSDFIDLRAIDANENRDGNQAFRFVGGYRYTDTPGELRFQNEILAGDTDGDGRSDFQIAVLDVSALREVDILL